MWLGEVWGVKADNMASRWITRRMMGWTLMSKRAWESMGKEGARWGDARRHPTCSYWLASLGPTRYLHEGACGWHGHSAGQA